MALLYERRYELLIGNGQDALRVSSVSNVGISGDGKRITQDPGEQQAFRIAFLVQHDYGDNQQFAEITVYGLSDETEARIQEQYTYVLLQAGYQEIYGPIFKGQIVNVERGRSGEGGVDKYIRFFCSTAQKEISTAYANLVFAENTDYTEIIRQCASAMGFSVVFVGDWSFAGKRAQSWVINGSAAKAFNRMSRTLQFDWFLRDNQTMVCKKKGYVVEGETFHFSSTTGMKGRPRLNLLGVDFTVSLNPLVQLGRVVEIDSTYPEFAFGDAYWLKVPRTPAQGQYEVARLTHAGDSRGQAWDTNLECWRYNAAERKAILDQVVDRQFRNG